MTTDFETLFEERKRARAARKVTSDQMVAMVGMDNYTVFLKHHRLAVTDLLVAKSIFKDMDLKRKVSGLAIRTAVGDDLLERYEDLEGTNPQALLQRTEELITEYTQWVKDFYKANKGFEKLYKTYLKHYAAEIKTKSMMNSMSGASSTVTGNVTFSYDKHIK